MTCLLLVRELGQAVARRASGIYRSGVEIDRCLTARGWDVLSHRDRDPLERVPDRVDVIWFYGGSDCQLDQAVAQAVKSRVPIVVTSSYTGHPWRSKWMFDRWQGWGASPLVYYGVWSDLVAHDPQLAAIRQQIVRMHKPLRISDDNVASVHRRGIAFGDLAKAQNTQLTRGLDVAQIVAQLHAAHPQEPLLFFKQYETGRPPPPGAQVVPPQRELLSWLGRRRLFVSLAVEETYAMVPMEAAAVGTPVLYRHMPQSLSQTIGLSGLMYDSAEQLIDLVAALIDDRSAWEAYSLAGHHNARAHQHYAVGNDLALRGLLARGNR